MDIFLFLLHSLSQNVIIVNLAPFIPVGDQKLLLVSYRNEWGYIYDYQILRQTMQQNQKNIHGVKSPWDD